MDLKLFGAVLSSPMMNLYDDLEEEQITEQSKVEVQQELEGLKKSYNEQKLQLSKLENENSILKANIQKLYKTAQLEIQRKDRMIAELRQ